MFVLQRKDNEGRVRSIFLCPSIETVYGQALLFESYDVAFMFASFTPGIYNIIEEVTSAGKRHTFPGSN